MKNSRQSSSLWGDTYSIYGDILNEDGSLNVERAKKAKELVQKAKKDNEAKAKEAGSTTNNAATTPSGSTAMNTTTNTTSNTAINTSTNTTGSTTNNAATTPSGSTAMNTTTNTTSNTAINTSTNTTGSTTNSNVPAINPSGNSSIKNYNEPISNTDEQRDKTQQKKKTKCFCF